MATAPLKTTTPTIDIYVKLAQYPILADKIRERMRQELFDRNLISSDQLEGEVKAKAIESQHREGVFDPFNKEPATLWQKRKARIRDFQTDFYFGHSLPTHLFEEIVARVIGQQSPKETPFNHQISFNPELAPWSMLFRQGEMYEALPPAECAKYNHHLEEIKVVLIKGMISDQLPYIGIAKKIFSISDLRRIYDRRIGTGKIGGKAAGMLLAWKILKQKNPEFGPDVSDFIAIPDSYFIGTDVIYEYRQFNKLEGFMNQKYLPIEEIQEQHEAILQAQLASKFQPEIVEELRGLLEEMGDSPLIVRSSSLLEDNFGYAFAGKYSSYFCPNQGSPKENLEDLLQKIKLVYASVINPDALLYRKQHNLIDYDERMAILIQRVRGKKHGSYFFPTLAGVGFSQNPFRWHPKIRREEGFLRLVLGMGTRAVDRVDSDYPRLISMSHPQLRPESDDRSIRLHSQRFMDVINLNKNELSTLPVSDVLTKDFPDLKYVASIDKEGYLQPFVSSFSLESIDDIVLTFDFITKDQKFIKLIRTALTRLEKQYRTPVDIEFAIEIRRKNSLPSYKLHLLQCRPLSLRKSGPVQIPTNIPQEKVLFRSFFLIPDGVVEGIRHIIFVDPETFYSISDLTIRRELGRAIGRLNHKLSAGSFIIMGPGRWGSSNIELGVHVTYGDINHTKALVEISVERDSGAPELSYGTHFYQDLVEAGIFSLPIHLEKENSHFEWEFFQNAHNQLASISPKDAHLAEYIKVIDLARERGKQRLTIIMDGNTDEAVGYFVAGEWQNEILDNAGTISNF